MSCLEQACLAIGEIELFMSLSVVASVQCCMVMSGIDEPVLTTFISQSPALRTGKSSASAAGAESAASAQHDKPNESSSRFMARSNSYTTMNVGVSTAS